MLEAQAGRFFLFTTLFEYSWRTARFGLSGDVRRKIQLSPGRISQFAVKLIRYQEIIPVKDVALLRKSRYRNQENRKRQGFPIVKNSKLVSSQIKYTTEGRYSLTGNMDMSKQSEWIHFILGSVRKQREYQRKVIKANNAISIAKNKRESELDNHSYTQIVLMEIEYLTNSKK